MIEASLTKIDGWLANNASKIKESLQAGAEDGLIARIGNEIGEALPQDAIALYKTYNGNHADEMANFFHGITFIPLEKTLDHITAAKNQEREDGLRYADEGIKGTYKFSPKRVAIGDDFATSLICIDLDPDEGGTKGQVIFLDYDYEVAFILADSVEQFIAQFADDLEAGKYSLAPDALEDGNHWLLPDSDIDAVNWFNSPTWKHIQLS